MVELEKKRRRPAKEVQELALDVSEIGGDDDPGLVGFEGVGDRFVRVVRGSERPEADLPDPPLAARLHAHERRKEVAFEAERVRGAGGREQRTAESSGKGQGADRVIADRIDIVSGCEIVRRR